MAALLHLPITGNLPEGLSTEETSIYNILTTEMERINKASGKYCYAYWLTRWWPRDEVLDRLFDGTLSIATFLCLWLSRDVFEDSGTLLKPFVVPFAIKISQVYQMAS